MYIYQGLPGYPQVDEDIIIKISYKLFIDNNYALDYFKYPSLSFYFSWFTLELANLLGFEVTLKDTPMYLRYGFSVLLSSSIFFLFFGVKLLFNRTTAIVAGLIFSASMYYPVFLFYAGPDLLMVFFANLIFYIFVLIYKSQNLYKQVYFLFPLLFILIGLSVAVKYNALIFFIGAFYLFIVKDHYKNLAKTRIFLLYASLPLLSAITFFLANPEVFGNWSKFIEHFLWNINHYKRGHLGLESNNPYIFYLRTFVVSSYGYFGAIIFLAGLILLIKDKKFSELMLLILLPIFLIIKMASYKVVLDRNIVIIMPYFIVIAAYTFYKFREWNFSIKILSILGLFLLISLNIFSLYQQSAVKDNREEMSKWIDFNIPEGSVIRIDKKTYRAGYLPKLNNKKFKIVFGKNVNQGEYYIASSFMYLRNIKKKINIFGDTQEYLYLDEAIALNKFHESMKIIKEMGSEINHGREYNVSGPKIIVFFKPSPNLNIKKN